MRCWLVVVMVAGCSADDADDVDRAKQSCEELRDHLIDLRLRTAHGDPKVVETHRAAMKKALGDDFVGSCQQRMTPSQIQCATSAGDFAAASACSARAQ